MKTEKEYSARNSHTFGTIQKKSNGILQFVDNRPLQSCYNKVCQRTYWHEGLFYSSFDRFNHKLQEDNGSGKGGALTIFKNDTSLFPHHLVSLEWYDGYENKEKNYVAHLLTPVLKEDYWYKKLNQVSSILPGRNMKSKVIKLTEWDFEKSKKKEHKTVKLSEEAKETKRLLLETENNKEYNYNVLGGISEGTYNCKTWAEKVAPECK